MLGVYVGRGGVRRTITFQAKLSGIGEYTFEADSMSGWYLTVDYNINCKGIPFLAKVS